jgi:rRNA maturation RNase YbeY
VKTLHFLNRQKICIFDKRMLRQIARELLDGLREGGGYTLGVHFVRAKEMAALNEQFLAHEGSTDVITFDYTPERQEMHGEIYICVDEALVQSRRFRVSWQKEITRYLVHGLLHMNGFDDSKPHLRRVMKQRENSLLKKLSRQFNLGKLGRKAVGAHERK